MGQRQAMEHDPAEAGQGPSAAGGQQYVGVGPAAVQTEQIHHAQGVPVILLAHHVAVHAENAHVAVVQGVVVHIHHAAVVDIRLRSTLPPSRSRRTARRSLLLRQPCMPARR